MAVSKADMAKTPGYDEKMLDKMRDLGVSHCNEDKWPAEATKCMTDAKTTADAQACYGKIDCLKIMPASIISKRAIHILSSHSLSRKIHIPITVASNVNSQLQFTTV